MEQNVYERLLEFKNKFPMTIAWRLKKHAKVVEGFLNPGETVRYAFAAQKNDSPFDIMSTNAIVLTDRRILIATKRILFGYFYTSITPELFNDLKVQMGLVWGKVIIDTVKEKVVLTNLERGALDEIETIISEYMMEEKRKLNLEK